VYGKEHFSEIANTYPLAILGAGDDSPGVLDQLLDMAHGGAKVTVL
jgi:hypothetical protein